MCPIRPLALGCVSPKKFNSVKLCGIHLEQLYRHQSIRSIPTPLLSTPFSLWAKCPICIFRSKRARGVVSSFLIVNKLDVYRLNQCNINTNVSIFYHNYYCPNKCQLWLVCFGSFVLGLVKLAAVVDMSTSCTIHLKLIKKYKESQTLHLIKASSCQWNL